MNHRTRTEGGAAPCDRQGYSVQEVVEVGSKYCGDADGYSSRLGETGVAGD